MRIRLEKLVLIFLLLFSAPALAQKSCDCPEKEDLNLGFSGFLSSSDLPGGTAFFQKMSKESTAPCRLHVSLQLANVAYNVHDSIALHSILETAATLADSACNPSTYASLLWRWSQYYKLSEKYDTALLFAQRSLDLCEKTGNTSTETAVLTTLAQIMMDIGDAKRAAYYQRKCALLCEATDNNKTGIAFGNLGAMYGAMFDASGDTVYLDSVIYALNKSNEFVRSRGTSLEQVSYNYSNIGQVYMLLEDFPRALVYTDSALSATNLDARARVAIYTVKYNIFAAMDDKVNALRFADSAYTLALQTEDTRTLVTTMTSLYEAHKLNGNTSEALSLFEKLVHIRDSINDSERLAAITEVEEKYNKTKNEKRIGELSQQQEISSLNIKLLTAGIIGSMLIILLVVIFFRQSVLKKNQIQLETEQRLNRARMNPHFFFNTLSSLQTSALKDKDPAKLADLLSMYSKIMRNTLESTYEDLVTIESEVEYLEMYLKLQQFRNNGAFTYSVIVEDDIDSSDILMPGMIIQPIVENAIEHGISGIDGIGMIEVSFNVKGNMLRVTVSDNGAGISAKSDTKSHKSRAMEITRDRLFLINKKHKSNASQTISANANNRGTIVEILLPLHY